MVVTSLKKNFIRGIEKNITQLLSIIIMLTLGISVYIGLDSTWRSLESYVDNHYVDDNVEDIIIYSDLLPYNYFKDIKDIKGIKSYGEIFQVKSELPSFDGAELETNFISSSKISSYNILEGKDSLTDNHCVLDNSFAKANNIKVGNKIKLKINSIEKKFTVSGLAVSSTHIYLTPDSTTVIPNYKKFGFIYINIDNSKEFFSNKVLTNKVIIKKGLETDYQNIKSAIEEKYEQVIKGIATREETINYLATSQKIKQYKSIGKLFPVVFFIIVILMTFTTMYRIINKERQTIGILKSLGYSSRRILLHYMSYGIWISVVGIILGTLIGSKLIPAVIWKFFKELFVFESTSIVLSYSQVLIVACISILSTVFAIMYVFLKTDKEKPAQLLRDKISVQGKNILLENFKNYWSKKTASQKLTLRQMFLNKVRVIMTILGVLGCTALLLSALGIRDTVDNVAKSVYDKTYLYTEKLYIDSSKLDKKIYDQVEKDSASEFIEELRISVSSDSRKKMGAVNIIENNSKLIKFYYNDDEVVLRDTDLLITEKASEIYGLEIEDKVRFRIANNNVQELKVTKIARINIGQGFYLTQSAWGDKGQNLVPTGILKGDTKSQYPENLITKTIVTKIQEGDFVKSMGSTISMSMMLIFAAAVLAIVVLYNLGVLNFSERERDLATLSVLGFFEKELKRFLSIENILLSITGIILGIPVGISMHKKIFESAGMGDELDFTAIIYNKSFAMTIAFTFLIVIVVNFLLGNRIKSIKMTEALKSVE
jgi:putative ABC transport system permease protein